MTVVSLSKFGRFLLLLLLAGVWACGPSEETAFRAEGPEIAIDFNQEMHSRVVSQINGQEIVLGDFESSEFLTVAGTDIRDFTLTEHTQRELNDPLGKGTLFIVTGKSDRWQKTVEIAIYPDFPTVAVCRVIYTNTGDAEQTVDRWVNNRYQLRTEFASAEAPPFWSYQSGSYESRPDWVLPLKAGFTQENYMGMNATDYGGGTPVVDVWRRDAGLAVGHLETVPKLVALPVRMPNAEAAYLGVEQQVNTVVAPGETLETLTTFVNVHQGDYFQSLVEYRRMMVRRGIHFDAPPVTSYEPIWCAWGFERDFTMEQIYNALPKVKELGYRWAVLDDGWQTAEGDWYLLPSKFPNGDRDMKQLVAQMRIAGLRPKLWWAPLAVDPGTDLIEQHPDYLLLNADGSRQDISWWDSYYLCPAYPPVQEYTRELVTKIMQVWGFDGLKIDGQHLNGAPPCYNPAHDHLRPEESFEEMPRFFQTIYETALEIKPDAVVEICPCGTAYAFHTLPYLNQTVASDPTSSWQIRLKGKTFKALLGPSAPYYGDHVELSDNRDDFASTMGVGGVIGTKFTWPVGAKEDSEIDLTAAKEQKWQKWLDIYKSYMLPQGEYLGTLYDLGFDRPEAHAIAKDGALFYAFYADDFRGTVELRGLEDKTYSVRDYVNDRDYGTVQGPRAQLAVEFQDHLLLTAQPQPLSE